MLCDFTNLDFRPKRHLKILDYELVSDKCGWLLNVANQMGYFFITLLMEKYMFCLQAFRDNLSIEHHSKIYLIFLLVNPGKSFMLPCEKKALENIIGLSIHVIFCRFFYKNQEKKEVLVLTLVGTRHLIVFREVFIV